MYVNICVLVRTALLAIIGFMPTHGSGAIGSLDYTPEERKVLASKYVHCVFKQSIISLPSLKESSTFDVVCGKSGLLMFTPIGNNVLFLL